MGIDARCQQSNTNCIIIYFRNIATIIKALPKWCGGDSDSDSDDNNDSGSGDNNGSLLSRGRS